MPIERINNLWDSAIELKKKWTKSSLRKKIILIVFLIIVALIYAYWYFNKPLIIKVPNVKTYSVKIARQRLNDDYLEPILPLDYDLEQMVLYQNPEHGDWVKKGTKVELVLQKPHSTHIIENTPMASVLPTVELDSFSTGFMESPSKDLSKLSTMETIIPHQNQLTPSLSTPLPQKTEEYPSAPTHVPFTNTYLNGYDKASNSYTYIQLGEYQKEPILWRILEADGNKLLLFSERIIEVMDFDNNANIWQGSEIDMWLNSTFLDSAFAEYIPSPIITKPGLSSVFLMSKSDLLNPDYGFSDSQSNADSNRASTISAFVENTYSSIINVNNGRLIYYTRDKSSTNNSTSLTAVRSTGELGAAKYDRASKGDGVGIRPALWINTEHITLTEGDGTLQNPYK